MAGIAKTTTKKIWIAPELKKTSIEQITASGGAAHPDAGGGNKS